MGLQERTNKQTNMSKIVVINKNKKKKDIRQNIPSSTKAKEIYVKGRISSSNNNSTLVVYHGLQEQRNKQTKGIHEKNAKRNFENFDEFVFFFFLLSF